MTAYVPAPAVKRIAEKLIADHGDMHLDEVRIEYVFRDKAQRTKGKFVLGTCRLVSGLNAYLATDRIEAGAKPQEPEKFYVIEIALDTWKQLDEAQQEALVDHELAHIYIDENAESGELTLQTRAHDVEEFASIIRRHGLWKPDLEVFGRAVAAAQPDLFDGEVEP